VRRIAAKCSGARAITVRPAYGIAAPRLERSAVSATAKAARAARVAPKVDHLAAAAPGQVIDGPRIAGSSRRISDGPRRHTTSPAFRPAR
jgi:hypothetical protein